MPAPPKDQGFWNDSLVHGFALDLGNALKRVLVFGVWVGGFHEDHVSSRNARSRMRSPTRAMAVCPNTRALTLLRTLLLAM